MRAACRSVTALLIVVAACAGGCTSLRPAGRSASIPRGVSRTRAGGASKASLVDAEATQLAPDRAVGAPRAPSAVGSVVHHDPAQPERLPPVETSAIAAAAASHAEPSAGLAPPERLPPLPVEDEGPSSPLTWPERLLLDQANFYSPRSVAPLGLALVAGAALANTGADDNFRHFYQENVRNAGTDEWYEALHAPKILGEGWVALPIYAGASLAGRVASPTRGGQALSTWGDRSWRSILVGAVPLIALQRATGGSRPGETDHSSDWRFNADNNGVSGHAFMGAVPFLAAASVAERPWLRLALYAGSTLTGLSRVNDDGHYFSQTLLGWSLAWVSVEAIRATDLEDEGREELRVGAFPGPAGTTFGFEINR